MSTKSSKKVKKRPVDEDEDEEDIETILARFKKEVRVWTLSIRMHTVIHPGLGCGLALNWAMLGNSKKSLSRSLRR